MLNLNDSVVALIDLKWQTRKTTSWDSFFTLQFEPPDEEDYN